MAGSTKPRRRRASAPALRYERRSGKPGSAGSDETKGEWAFGCLLFLGFVAIIVLLAVLDRLWGVGAWWTLPCLCLRVAYVLSNGDSKLVSSAICRRISRYCSRRPTAVVLSIKTAIRLQSG